MYRFGFNGQEKDDEITGVTGSHLNFKYRMYDSRVARFFAVDPLAAKYPWWTPYQFAGNMPIQYRELEGLEPNTTTRSPNQNMNSQRLNRTLDIGDEGLPIGRKGSQWDFITSSRYFQQDGNYNYKWYNKGTIRYYYEQYSTAPASSTTTTSTSTSTQEQNSIDQANNNTSASLNFTVADGVTGASVLSTPNDVTLVNNVATTALEGMGVTTTTTGTPELGTPTIDVNWSSNGLTLTTDVSTATSQTNTTANSNVVINISFNTTNYNVAFGQNVNQQRFNALQTQLIDQGVPAANINYNQAGNNYNMTPAQMGGAANQTIFNLNQTTTTNSTTTTTTNTQTTTDRW